MAYYIHSRRDIVDGRSGEIKDYYMDFESDISSLPVQPEIMETSTAYVPSTGRMAVLMTNGWEWFTFSNNTGGGSGVDGKSAYQIWLEAGNTGTVQDFLISLRGEGVPPGGTTGQVLAKTSNADYATQWVTPQAASSYTHNQTTPSERWDIQHNLNRQIVKVFTVDGDGKEIVGIRDTELSTMNLLVIRFSEPLVGTAYI